MSPESRYGPDPKSMGRSAIGGGAGLLAALALASAPVGVAGPAAASPRQPATGTTDVRFVQIARSSNTPGFFTIINNAATNGKPKARLFVTPNWNPSNTPSGTYDDHPIGVFYDNGARGWAILNEDFAKMPLHAAFNVLVAPRTSSTVFTVTATSSNSAGDSLYLNRSVTNHHPNAILQVTQNLSAGGQVYNKDNVGVWYDGTQWAIFNEDHADMKLGVSFNVLVGTTGTGAYGTVLKASHLNTFVNYTLIHNRRTNNNSRALVFATPNWNPGGHGGTYDATPIGVWYDKNVSPHLWSVFNQNTALDMPVGAAFNLLIYPGR